MKELIKRLRTTAPKAERFQSNALWPAEIRGVSKYGDNISTDTHDTEEQAKAVCDALEREGFGGERKVFPLKTWVSPVQDPPVTQAADALEQQAAELVSLRLERDMRRMAERSNTELRKQIEELAAALAGKDEALSLARKEFDGLPHSLGYDFTHTPKIDSALALQPHASLVAKIKADAVREAMKEIQSTSDDWVIDYLTIYADRIERGEVM